MEKLVDGVFEGGGVKGIGLVGAVSVVEAEGYKWGNLAGTSAGAIVAALLAAGYNSAELKAVMASLDYTKFKDKGAVDRIPIFGPLVSFLTEKGVYEGNYLETWIRGLLAAKGVRTFKDLLIPGEKDPRYRYKLYVIASDITNQLLVALPTGVEKYGLNPDDVEVARAVRMSMSIPFFFEPVKIKDNYFVDGGLLSNFPIWIFDSKGKPAWPTFGFKLIEPGHGQPKKIGNPLQFTAAILETMMEAHDKMHVENEDFVRTIPIPTMGVRTTEFNLSAEKRDALYRSGVDAAKEFFKTWNFQAYARKYRTRRDPRYAAKVKRLRSELVV
ncbi:MAG: patatin-like phospholipase family protein [Elusimicrobiota bacterium]